MLYRTRQRKSKSTLINNVERMPLMNEDIDKEKLRYRQFVEMINTLRSLELISAEYRRELDRKWRTEPNQRELILEELDRLNNEYSEKRISSRNSL